MKLDDLIELSTVCKKFFNQSPSVARRSASLGKLPVPATRLTGNQRGPFYIRRVDFEAWLNKRFAEAAETHRKMQGALKVGKGQAATGK